MEYKIEDIDGKFSGEINKNLGNSEFLININGKESILKILNIDPRGIEFILDQKYHKVKYIENSISKMNLVVNNTPLAVTMHNDLNEIVYKNSGGSSSGDTQLGLKSQIPGKVVSIAVTEGSAVKKGDTVCVLESMKMQVSVKSHKDGTIKTIKIKQGGAVAKNDVIAEIE